MAASSILGILFHHKNTWTRAFVCLVVSEQNAIPATSKRITLTLNGLTSVVRYSIQTATKMHQVLQYLL